VAKIAGEKIAQQQFAGPDPDRLDLDASQGIAARIRVELQGDALRHERSYPLVSSEVEKRDPNPSARPSTSLGTSDYCGAMAYRSPLLRLLDERGYIHN